MDEDDECGHDCKHRYVQLPPAASSKCQVCGVGRSAETKLTLCSACGERVYCGQVCQKKDWASHKANCGKTDRIALESFYPFLAYMAETCHVASQAKSPHFALCHKITNNVNPLVEPIKQPDGWESKLVMVDDTDSGVVKPSSRFIKDWFPKAQSESVAVKLFKRILREGYSLSILTSICLAILSEVYTTLSGKDTEERRIRFRYRSSPIADFGIAKGSAEVTSTDKLAYYRKSTGEIVHGQDPNDHYWLYFTTVRGEEIEVDFSMYTFNMCTMVPLEQYVSARESETLPFAPVFFRERVVRKNTPPLHKEYKRFSALRNHDLQLAIVHAQKAIYPEEEEHIYRFLRLVSGQEFSTAEKDMTCRNAMSLCCLLSGNLSSRAWEKYPAAPPAAIDGDRGELDNIDDPTRPLPKFKASRRRRA